MLAVHTRAATEDASPFLYQMATRTAKGAAAGFVLGRVFFRPGALRRCSTMYGAGVGLGMSYSQVRALWGALTNTEAKSDEAFHREVQSLETELRLRYKLK